MNNNNQLTNSMSTKPATKPTSDYQISYIYTEVRVYFLLHCFFEHDRMRVRHMVCTLARVVEIFGMNYLLVAGIMWCGTCIQLAKSGYFVVYIYIHAILTRRGVVITY